ncbi:MAG: DUF3887 domain-containing protein [Lachnospiraceae bacterium]|nr:DUF3887 domain-containing protein [Lachnospiraceae bacterium]
MDKRIFLKKLDKGLKKLLPEERARYISYYDEIIMDLVEGGLSEQEAVAKQGDISHIVLDVMSQIEPENMEKKNPLEILLFVLGCLIAAICVVVLIALPDVITFSMMNEGGAVSVFIAGKVFEPVWLYILTVTVLLVGIIVFVVRKRKGFMIALVVAFIICVITFVAVRLIDDSKSSEANTTEVMEVYASKEVEERTILIIELISCNDFSTIREEYSLPELREVLKDDYMLQSKAMVNEDWGELVSIGTVYSVEVTQNNTNYIVVQVIATYDNVSVAYTITFDENLMLAGIYMM